MYRLVTKGTIEERIVKRAQQKQNVQTTVYSGGAFKADIFKPSEVMELLFDENEIKSNEAMRFMAKGNQNKKISKYKKSNFIFNFRGSNLGFKVKIINRSLRRRRRRRSSK